MDRKNWLFSGSETGAESSCFLFTLIETAKLYKLDPYEYLRCVFDQAPFCESEKDFEKLLPWNIKITEFNEEGTWKIDAYRFIYCKFWSVELKIIDIENCLILIKNSKIRQKITYC